MLDWMIIGGGPHGVHAAARLIGEAGVSRESIAILDDQKALLERWRLSTSNTGMRFLRSPVVHHLGLSSASLQRFAGSGGGRRVERPFTRPYSRPCLELFDLHCDKVIDDYELQDLHLRGRASGLEISERSVRVKLNGVKADEEGSELEARHLILALGAPQDPTWPAWARDVDESACEMRHPSPIAHIFDPGFELIDNADDEAIAVVGAGISGAQVSVRLAREGRQVFLLSRHPLQIHQFDSDPGWQGPKYMAGFSRLTDPAERRDRIVKARHRGSIPSDVHSELRQAIKAGTVEHLEWVEVTSASLKDEKVSLEIGDRHLEVDRVLLATGFPSDRPGAGWLDQAIEEYELPCAECGYPLVDRGLRWHPRVLVTGSLAELEIGPVSRNLSGAQRAGDRIVAVARQD